MTYDVSIPGQLMSALGPDLLLMGGAMILLLWSAWKPERRRTDIPDAERRRFP